MNSPPLTWAALAVVSIDAAYTTWFWLILGRDERLAGPHPVRDYFAILAQLGIEVAAVAHLAAQVRRER